MKKFYSILAAAFAGTMMVSAATPVQLSRNAEKSFNTISAQKSDAKHAYSVKSTDVVRVADDDPNAQLPDMTGHYFFTATMNDEVSNYSLDLERVEGVNYLVKNLIFGSSAKDIPATFQYEDIQFSDGTYSVPTLTIKGSGVNAIYESQGSEYMLYFFGYEGTQPTLYSDDIQFMLTNDGSLMWPFNPTANLGIGWVNSQMRGNWIVNPSDLMPANGSYHAYDYFASDEAKEDTYIDGGVLVEYAEEGEEAAISVRNLFDCDDYSLDFVVDKTTNTIIGEPQTIVELTTDQGATWTPFELDSYTMSGQNMVPGNGIEATYEVFDLGNEKFKTVITFPTEGLMIYNQTLGIWRIYDEATLTLNFAIASNKPAGIENVIANDDANAPVEYFNLQGVRVENPAAGIYVRRQGNTVSKVLVK